MPSAMQSALVIRIEKAVDRSASAVFGLACGYATSLWFVDELTRSMLGAATLAATAFAYFISVRTLGAVHPQLPRLKVPIFDVRDVESLGFAEANEAEERDQVELLLTDPLEPEGGSDEESLLLDDVLAEIGSSSRVVRLFDPSAMPSAGGLKSRIDDDLGSEISAAQSHDATKALHDALADLRRSLR
jgi:hypothetical protein